MAALALQEKPKWQLESSVNSCTGCSQAFSTLVKKHHCRACGKIFCGDCSIYQRELPQFGYVGLQTCCKPCKLAIEGDNGMAASAYTTVGSMMRDLAGYYSFKVEMFQSGTRGAPRKLLAEATDSTGGSYLFSMTTISDDGAAIFKDESKRRLFPFIIKDTITHPYILAPKFAQLRDAKAIVISPFHASGSIRDLIYLTPEMKKKKITPKSKHFEKYYTNAKGGQPLSVALVAKYGRQVLEALFYLYLHGFPFPHLHSGNVVVSENDHAQLTDLENSLLCLDPKPNREIKRMLVTHEEMAPEVIAFGHLLYEMALGHEKGDRTLKEIQAKCPPTVFPILQSILEPASPDTAATLKSLLRLPFFQEVTLDVTVHQVVLTEKWDDRARAILKPVRAAATKITTPPAQPLLRTASSAIKLSAGSSASLNAPTTTHASSGSSTRTKTATSSSSSSSASTTKKPSSRTVNKTSTSSTSSSATSTSIPKAPTPPPSAPTPPPPPPASMAKMPAPQIGRDSLMASIRAAGGLKSVKKNN